MLASCLGPRSGNVCKWEVLHNNQGVHGLVAALVAEQVAVQGGVAALSWYCLARRGFVLASAFTKPSCLLHSLRQDVLDLSGCKSRLHRCKLPVLSQPVAPYFGVDMLFGVL
eukprot:GHUV01037483.1.p1 GENE.GHUV01037483.1~~GHUV01037483.1.p1  ORF type:complete len:112 (+),score=5.05 GHUV01037483.1:105-440(+)